MWRKPRRLKIDEELIVRAYELYDQDITDNTPDQLFSAQLDTDQEVYISLGNDFQATPCMTVLVGEEGLDSYRDILNISEDNPIHQIEAYFSQKGFQLIFTDDESVDEEYKKLVRKIARKHHLNIYDYPGYPVYLKFIPHQMPYQIEELEDKHLVLKSIKAALDVAEDLNNPYGNVILYPLVNGKGVVPTYQNIDSNKEKFGKKAVPLQKEREYFKPKLEDEILISKLKKLQRNQDVFADFFYLPEPYIKDDGLCVFPCTIWFVNSNTEFLYDMPIFDDEDLKDFTKKIGQAFLDNDFLPQKISVKDDRTYYLLKDFCEKLGIELEKNDDNSLIKNIQTMYLETSGQNELDLYDKLIEQYGDSEELAGFFEELFGFRPEDNLFSIDDPELLFDEEGNRIQVTDEEDQQVASTEEDLVIYIYPDNGPRLEYEFLKDETFGEFLNKVKSDYSIKCDSYTLQLNDGNKIPKFILDNEQMFKNLKLLKKKPEIEFTNGRSVKLILAKKMD